MGEPDEWLMQQVCRGAVEHLEVLIRRHSQGVLTFASRVMGSVDRGEEAMQETFVAVWAGRGTYRYPAYFRPWLYAIARNKCRELARRRGMWTESYGEEPDPGELSAARPTGALPGPMEVAMALETDVLVEQAVGRLPEQQRAVVVMRVWNQMSYTEIAQALGVTEATVRSTMHHGLAQLRRFLEPRMREGRT